MISIFHFLAAFGCLVGLVVGAVAGHAHFGWWGALFGVPGGYAGLVIGRLPRLISVLILRRSQSADSPEVKEAE